MDQLNPQKRNRGFASAKDITSIGNLPIAKIQALPCSPFSWERTAAVLALSSHQSPDDVVFATQLLHMLQGEKALYTRLAICEVLQAGTLQTAKLLCGYLGHIGNNQLTEPKSPSKKKSYPLPRDLAARILGKMQPEILPALTEVLQGNNLQQILEGIDAYGYLLFYNPAYATKEHFLIVKQLLATHASNELLVFKCATCLSAFALEVGNSLLELLKNHTNSYITQNANRSLLLLKNKKEHL